jgi:hypothetical protein
MPMYLKYLDATHQALGYQVDAGATNGKQLTLVCICRILSGVD